MLAERWRRSRPSSGSDAVVFVVLAQDEIGSHVWSLTAAAVGSDGLRVQRGRPAPARAELRMTFPAFLSLLAGTLTVERAIAAGRLDVSGDPAFVAVRRAATRARRRPMPRPRDRSVPCAVMRRSVVVSLAACRRSLALGACGSSRQGRGSAPPRPRRRRARSRRRRTRRRSPTPSKSAKMVCQKEAQRRHRGRASASRRRASRRRRGTRPSTCTRAPTCTRTGRSR